MILKLLRAPINLFHDIVSIGQILNRLTKDVEIVQLIINRVTVFFKSFALLASCIYICFIYNKYSLILSPVLLFFSLLLTIYYLSAARNMEHLHRTTFSPILTILNESIRGVELIRNFNNEENIKNKIYYMASRFGGKAYEIFIPINYCYSDCYHCVNFYFF